MRECAKSSTALCVALFMVAPRVWSKKDIAGWHREADGKWWHEFHAHLDEWEVVGGTGLKKELRYVMAPTTTLPAGWEERADGTFVDTMLNEVSNERPVGFQNEGSFKNYFVSVVEQVRQIWDRTWPAFLEASDQILHARELSLDVIQGLLRIVKSPALFLNDDQLADLEQRNLSAEAAVSKILGFHVAPRETPDAQAKFLFISAGQEPTDFYLSGDSSVPLPPYLKESLRNPKMFLTDAHLKPCTLNQGGRALLDGKARPFKRRALVTDSTVVSELAVPLFIRQFIPSVKVDILDACHDLGLVNSTAFLDEYDFIYLAHQGSQIPPDKRWLPFKSREEVETALRRTKAEAWSIFWQAQHSNKTHIPLTLRAHGVPAVDAMRINLQQDDPNTLATSTLQLAAARKFKKIILKPDESAYMQSLGMVELADTDAHTKLSSYLAQVKRTGLKGVAVQKYIRSFKLNYEVSFFLFGGQWGMAVAKKVDALKFSRRQPFGLWEWDWFDIHGGKLNSSAFPNHKGRVTDVQKQLVPLAKLALKALVDGAAIDARLPAGVSTWPLLRVDLGCCLQEGDLGFEQAQGWFVNEAEPWPDFTMKYFWRMLVNEYDKESIPFQSNARILEMLQRAAALWYPITEHAGLEFARFILGATAARSMKQGADLEVKDSIGTSSRQDL